MWLVFDLCNSQSFDHLENIWIEDLKESLPNAVMFLVGNKCDKIGAREITQEQIDSFCRKFKIDAYREVSALAGINIMPQLI